MDPQFRSRLIAAIILLIVVCSAFSVSPVAGFRLENRDGSGTAAALAEALVLQQSTKIRNEYMENLTVYIDSRNEVFGEQGGPEPRSVSTSRRRTPSTSARTSTLSGLMTSLPSRWATRSITPWGSRRHGLFDPCRKARVVLAESAPRPVRRGSRGLCRRLHALPHLP